MVVRKLLQRRRSSGAEEVVLSSGAVGGNELWVVLQQVLDNGTVLYGSIDARVVLDGMLCEARGIYVYSVSEERGGAMGIVVFRSEEEELP